MCQCTTGCERCDPQRLWATYTVKSGDTFSLRGVTVYLPADTRAFVFFDVGGDSDCVLAKQTLQASVPVPDGWKLVPVEPTEEMLGACAPPTNELAQYEAMRAYAAMLTAAPPPPTTSLSVALAEERERCRFALERCKAYLATRANVMGEQPAEERLLAREIDAALGPARGTE